MPTGSKTKRSKVHKGSWPSRTIILEVLKELEDAEGTYINGDEIDQVELLKQSICQEIIIYFKDYDQSQSSLAKKMGIDPALMSKILHNNYKEFTLDRLMRYFTKIYPHAKIKMRTA